MKEEEVENIVKNETININRTSKSINDIEETDFFKQISDSEKPAQKYPQNFKPAACGSCAHEWKPDRGGCIK